MDLYKDLLVFYNELKEYKVLLSKLYPNPPVAHTPLIISNPFSAFEGDTYRKKQAEEQLILKKIEEKREYLIRSYPALSQNITRLTGKSTIEISDIWSRYTINVWDVGLQKGYSELIAKALDACLDYTNEAIGKLQAEGESWNVPIIKLTGKPQKPKAFISHSGNTAALTELRDYLDELGIEKLLVIKKPNLDREINLKVEAYLDEADFVIILATGDSKDRNENIMPGGNVLHEIGLAQAIAKFKGKIIYLLEEGAEFPSNIKPKSYIRFNRDNIEYKFGDIVKEIKKMGFLG